MKQGYQTRELVLMGLFTGLTCLVAMILKWGGEVLVPFSFLPMMALLAGALLGSRAGALSMVAYMLMGLIGIPVFSKPPYGGPVYIVQPTFGFILGFVAAAWVTGKLLEGIDNPSWLRYATAMGVGLAVVYGVGLPYLWLIVNFYLGKAMNVLTVIKVGFLPFIGLDLIKTALAMVLARLVHQRVQALVKKPA